MAFFDNPNSLSSSIAGTADAFLTGKGTQGGVNGIYPWEGVDKAFRAFYPNTPIDAARWNKMYPYKLLVIDARNNKVVVGTSPNGSGKITTDPGEGGASAAVYYTGQTDKWEFTFPITPQSISNETNFAIGVDATQQGISEEHNGVVFKPINLSFTTGVWPGRNSVVYENKKRPSVLSSLAGDSIAAFDKTVASISAIGSGPAVGATNEPEGDQLYSTGYFQALFLERFLEQYALAKKSPENEYWRLCFFNQKDNEAYLVTPIKFSRRKSAQKAMHVQCDLALTAYRRIEVNAGASKEAALGEIDLNSPDFLTRALNAITQARSAISNAMNLIKAVRSDFNRPFQILRQGAMLIKELAGVARTAADLPSALISDLDRQLAQIASEMTDAAEGLGGGASGMMLSSANRRRIGDMQELSYKNGGSIKPVGGVFSNTGNDPALNPFKNAESNFDLMNSLSIDDLVLTDAQRRLVSQDLEAATGLTVDQIKAQADELDSLLSDISNQYGAGDATLNDILGKPAPRVRSIPLTIDEIEILDSLNEAITAYKVLTSTVILDNQRVLNPIQFTYEIANENGVKFNNSESKMLVPVPIGFSLEKIAQRYLGDASRWIEISTLNGLRSPYIDETGFFLSLLSNGDGRRFTVSSDSRLYIGQKILLYSNTVPRFSRKITQIDKIGEDSLLITVDGAADVGVLKTLDEAQIQGFLAGTINSQDQIFVPIDGQPGTPIELTPPPEALQGDAAVAASKVDILLDEDGDVVFDARGDFRLAAGMTNLIQALTTILLTRLGGDIGLPSLGISAGVGQSVADLSPVNIFSEIERQINEDPRFARVLDMRVQVIGGAAHISIAVEEAGNGTIVPVTFVVKK